MADGVSEDVSREKLENELKGIETSIEELEERVSDIEDRDMMAQLESLSIEDEVNEIEDMLNHMDKEELEKRLNMVEQIKEEYQEGKVHEKLEYLYEQIKDIREKEFEAPEIGEEFEERLEEIEKKVENVESDSSMPEKYRKAVRANYEQIKKLKTDIESGSAGSVDKQKLKKMEQKLDELEQIKENVNSDEFVYVEERQTASEPESSSGADLSAIEFDLKSIKSRLEEVEKHGAGSKIDEANVTELRKKVKRLEKRLDNQGVTEKDLNDRTEVLRQEMDDKLRRIESELDRAERNGKERIESMEQLLQEKVLEGFEDEEELGSKLDSLTQVISENQEYIEKLEEKISELEAERSELIEKESELESEEAEAMMKRLERLEKRLEENRTPKNQSETLEEKIDNLAEHVLRNQEKIHDLEMKIESGSKTSQSDVTIIS